MHLLEYTNQGRNGRGADLRERKVHLGPEDTSTKVQDNPSSNRREARTDLVGDDETALWAGAEASCLGVAGAAKRNEGREVPRATSNLERQE